MTKKYQVAIVEDEKILSQHLKNILLTRYDDIEVVGEAENVSQVLALFEAYPEIDCLFMDIRLEMNGARAGVDLAINLHKRNQKLWFIFTTAFINYAAEILNNDIKLKVIGYLSKPLNITELDNLLDRLRNPKTLKEDKEPRIEIIYKIVNSKGEREKVIEIVNRMDIVYVQKNKQVKTVQIKLIDNRLLEEISGTLAYWEEILNRAYFQKVHKSHFVNICHIQSIHPPHPSQKASFQVAFQCCNERLTISGNFYDVLLKKLIKQ